MDLPGVKFMQEKLKENGVARLALVLLHYFTKRGFSINSRSGDGLPRATTAYAKIYTNPPFCRV